VIISDFDEFLIAYDEAIPRHFEDVDLLADEAGELTGCLSLTFVGI
jgi:hypothetical protein